MYLIFFYHDWKRDMDTYLFFVVVVMENMYGVLDACEAQWEKKQQVRSHCSSVLTCEFIFAQVP